MVIIAIPKFHSNRRRYGAGKLWVAPLGTVTSSYAPAGASSAFTQGTSANNVPGDTDWLPLGITQEGMTFSSSSDTEPDESAEYYYPHKILVTGQSATMSATLKTVNLTNLRTAFNAATSAVSATPGPSTAARLTPPLPGEEVRCQIMWESLDDDMVIILYQCMNTGAVEIGGRKGAEGTNVPLELTAELPDEDVALTPVDIWVIGASYEETVTGD